MDEFLTTGTINSSVISLTSYPNPILILSTNKLYPYYDVKVLIPSFSFISLSCKVIILFSTS